MCGLSSMTRSVRRGAGLAERDLVLLATQNGPPGCPFALDLDVHRRVGLAVADAEQVIRGEPPRSVYAGVQCAERLEVAAREHQAQDRSRQRAQQVPEGHISLAHCCEPNITRG
jgi:hypothetical protein